MHPAHQAHCLVGAFRRLVTEQQRARQHVVHNQIGADRFILRLARPDTLPQLDHERRRAEHHAAPADLSGKAALDKLHVARRQRHTVPLPHRLGQHTSQLKAGRIRERRGAAQQLIVRHPPRVLQRLQADRARGEQVVFGQDDLLGPAQKVGLARPCERRARPEQAARDVLIARAERA